MNIVYVNKSLKIEEEVKTIKFTTGSEIRITFIGQKSSVSIQSTREDVCSAIKKGVPEVLFLSFISQLEEIEDIDLEEGVPCADFNLESAERETSMQFYEELVCTSTCIGSRKIRNSSWAGIQGTNEEITHLQNLIVVKILGFTQTIDWQQYVSNLKTQ